MRAARRARALALVLAAAVFAAFAPALGADWVLWDDDKNFLENEAWRGLSLEHLRWMFTTFHLGPYQPLSWVSLALDHAAWGMDARGYHATSVMLHALTTAAFFFLARQVLAHVARPVTPLVADLCAAAAALAFGIHPLRCESVAWITERRDVLSGLFLVLCVLAYLRYARGGDAPRRWYALALGLYAASLLSKGLGMMLPPVLLLLDVFVLARTGARPGARSLVRLCLEKGPFALLALAALALAWIGQSALPGTMLGLEHHSFVARAAQAAFGLAFYVHKTLLPIGLVPLVPLPVPLHPGEARFVASALLVLAAIALLVALRRRLPATGAAFASYALLLAPVLGFAQTGPQLVADRYSYLACMPLALLAAGAHQAACARRPSLSPWALALAAVLLGALGTACFRQARIWRDTIALFTRVSDARPDDRMARRNLIVAQMRAAAESSDPRERDRLYDLALVQCAVGIERSPDPAFLTNAASIHDALSRLHPEREQELLALAIDNARRAVELGERIAAPLPQAYRNLAILLHRAGRSAEALPALEWLAQNEPDDPESHLMLGQGLRGAGRTRDALAPLERARDMAPDAPMTWIEIGAAHRELGEAESARLAYRRGIELEEARLGALAGASLELRGWKRELAELER